MKLNKDELTRVIRSAHDFALKKQEKASGKEKEGTYKFHYIDRLFGLLKRDYKIVYRQREIQRFENELWKAMELLKHHTGTNTRTLLVATKAKLEKMLNQKSK